jgi:hypothetical protein
MESTAQLLEDSLLVIWNDRNAENRAAAMKDIYAADIMFFETNDGPAIKGHQAINELIVMLQAQWPAEFTFELTAPARVNHQVQHIAWRLGVPGQPPVATGMDVAVVENGRIASLHLFLDAPADKA